MPCLYRQEEDAIGGETRLSFICTPLISFDLLVGAGDTCWCPAGHSSDGEACSAVCTILESTDVIDWLSNGLLQHCRVCLALRVNCEELGR